MPNRLAHSRHRQRHRSTHDSSPRRTNSPPTATAISHPLAPTTPHQRYESVHGPISSRRGTPYDCNGEYVRLIWEKQGPYREPGSKISLDRAALELERHDKHQPTKEALEALQHLRQLHTISQHGGWYADLPFKIFEDLDKGLFGGTLGGRIHLRWLTEFSSLHDARMDAWTSPSLSKSERVGISLNARALLLERTTLESLVGILVHECVVSFKDTIFPKLIELSANSGSRCARSMPTWRSAVGAAIQVTLTVPIS